jgi:hypothetical protein
MKRGLQSTKQGSEVLRLAERHGNRVVFVGDTRQHASSSLHMIA